MESSLLAGTREVADLQNWIAGLGPAAGVVDFDEQIQLAAVRATTRIWRYKHELAGFAYLDEANNLWFEIEPNPDWQEDLEDEIVAWGETCLARRNRENGATGSLDCVCKSTDIRRLRMLKRHGFERQDFRSLLYSRPLSEPVPAHPLAAGFSIRPIKGESEVQELVSLHRAAFGTEYMTVPARLAMIGTAQYHPDLDLVAVSPDGDLAAFCVCGLDAADRTLGTTDPIGTHPRFRRQGLGKAIVSAGLRGLKNEGAAVARLGTGSDNLAMRNLAEMLGYTLVSEKYWFSKVVRYDSGQP